MVMATVHARMICVKVWDRRLAGACVVCFWKWWPEARTPIHTVTGYKFVISFSIGVVKSTSAKHLWRTPWTLSRVQYVWTPHDMALAYMLVCASEAKKNWSCPCMHIQHAWPHTNKYMHGWCCCCHSCCFYLSFMFTCMRPRRKTSWPNFLVRYPGSRLTPGRSWWKGGVADPLTAL